MTLRKKIIYLSLIIVSIIILCISSCKVFFKIKYPEKELKKIVTDFFKDNFNKAVKFEDVYIDYLGNIFITNFNISNSSDFNDNMSLIKSKKVIFCFQFFDLLQGDYIINGIEFYDSDITFIKRYGKGYIESFKQIIDIQKDYKDIKNINLKDFNIIFEDTNCYYIESFKDTKLTIELYQMYTKFSLIDKKIKYHAKGYIKPHKTYEINKGKFNIKGSFLLDKNSSENYIEIDNYDLSYLNDYIKEYQFADITLKGGASSDIEIINENNIKSIKGRIEANNLYLISYPPNTYNILSNENLNIDIDVDIKKDYEEIKLAKLKFYDDIFHITASGDYTSNKDSKKVNLKFKSNKIDLESLSNYIIPFKDTSYKGYLTFNGEIKYDIKNNTTTGSEIKLLLKKFGIVTYKNGKANNVIDDGGIDLKFQGNNLDIDAHAKSSSFDISMKSITKLTSIDPLKTATNITLQSDKVNSESLFFLLESGADKLFHEAYEDQKQGYDDIFFLQKPFGKFVNNNNIDLKYTIKNIVFNKKTKLNNFLINLELKDGIVTSKEFNLQGYDAQYSFGTQIYFNRDYPYISFKGNVNGFDLDKFTRDRYSKEIFSGKFSSDFDYELTAYRLSQILENSKTNFNLNFSSGNLKYSYFQNKLIEFLTDNEYTSIDIQNLNINNIAITLSQSGEDFYFRNFSINSDIINSNAYGKYNYVNGLDMTINAGFKNKFNYVNIPIKLKDKLLSPCMTISNKKDTKETCF